MRRVAQLVTALVLGLTAVLPARAQLAAEAEARERVERGERLFARGDYAGAIAEYERAYELVPGHPVQHHALFNVAKCHEKLFQYRMALDYYERYLREGGPQAQRRDEVERAVAFLRDNLATLQLHTDVPAEVWVDGRLAGAAPGAVLVGGGRHTVTVRAAGYEPAVFEVALAVRQAQRRRVSLRRLSDVAGAPPGWFWASAGTAGAALATGLVLGAIALDKSNELDARLADPVEALAVTPREVEEVSDFALGADVALGTAAVLTVTSLALYFATDWRDEPGGEQRSPRAGTLAPARLRASAGPRSFGVALEGAL